MDRSKDIVISGGEVGGRHDPDGASSLAIERGTAHLCIPLLSTLLTRAIVLLSFRRTLTSSRPPSSRPHPKWGERLMASVILRPQRAGRWKDRATAFERDLKARTRKTLTGLACREWVDVVATLPTSFCWAVGRGRGRLTGRRMGVENVDGQDPEGGAAQVGRRGVDSRDCFMFGNVLLEFLVECSMYDINARCSSRNDKDGVENRYGE